MPVSLRPSDCLLAAFASLLPAQNLIVDGDLEGHTAVGCTYNLGIPQFNTLYANVHSFGSSSGIDIMGGGCFGLPPHSGATKLGLAWNNAAAGDKDAMSLDLAAPLVPGQAYSLSLWSEWLPFGSPQPFQVGVSSSPTAFGALVHAATPQASGFALHTAVFTAPSAATYLTVQVPPGSDTWIAFDALSLQPAGGTVAVNTSFGVACGGLLLAASTRSVLGTSWQLDVLAVPPAATLGILLLDFASPGSPLGPAAPGCTLYSGGLVLTLLPLPIGTPAAVFGLPAAAGLAGIHVFAQAGALVPGLNPLSIAASNGLDGLLGTL
jgi:hypothetical protein